MTFETETCSRCRGTGSYSYCQMYGTRCFKCRGKGQTYSRRGAVARAYYENLCTVMAKNLKPGDIVLETGITHGGSTFRYRGTVVSAGRPGGAGEFEFKTTHPKYGDLTSIVGTDTGVRVCNLPDQDERLKKALEYQANLTKGGTERKRSKKNAR